MPFAEALHSDEFMLVERSPLFRIRADIWESIGEGRAPMDLSQFRKNLDQQGSPLASADPAVDMALICNTALSDTVRSMEEMLKATTDRMAADQVKANEDVVSDIASPLGLS